MMAFTSVEDLTGTMEIIVFPRVLDTFRDALKENAVVVIEGRLSVREDEPSKLMAESILPIEGYDPSVRRPTARTSCGMLPKGSISVCRPAAARSTRRSSIFLRYSMAICQSVFYLEDVRQKLADPPEAVCFGATRC